MSHMNVANISGTHAVHSMPSLRNISQVREDTVRPYASATEVSGESGLIGPQVGSNNQNLGNLQEWRLEQ